MANIVRAAIYLNKDDDIDVVLKKFRKRVDLAQTLKVRQEYIKPCILKREKRKSRKRLNDQQYTNNTGING